MRRHGVQAAGLLAAAALALAAAAVAACGPSAALPSCSEGDCAPEVSRTWAFQSTVQRELDLLVVVGDRQTAGAAAPLLAHVLENLPRGTPALHALFVPAELPDGACTPPTARGEACGLTSPAGYLTTLACGERPNFAGALADTFSCLADLDAAGCARQQPLEAIRRALEGTPGFRRPEAFLQVVIVAGGDDASERGGALVPVADVVTFLKTVTDDPYKVAVSVIGPRAACATGAPPEEVVPRLTATVLGLGSAGLYAYACDGNFGVALERLAESGELPRYACVSGVRDQDPGQAGLQPECVVDDWSTQLDGSERHALLPGCDAAAPPCWRLETGPWCPDGGAFVVDRGPRWCPQLSARTQITCLGCADAADPACAPPP